MKQFTHQTQSDLRPDQVRRKVMTKVIPVLGNANYTILSDSQDAIALQREYRSAAVIIFAILLFPIGLLLLLIKSRALLTFTFTPDETGTIVRVAGKAPSALATRLKHLDY